MSKIQAVVKTSYTRKPGAAKASIRYVTHRIDREGNRITRNMFGNFGSMTKDQAYRMIDRAKCRPYFYRIVISPENSTGEPRDLVEITRETMQELKALLGAKRPIPFIAVAHTDHSDTPHVHVLAILRTYLSVEQPDSGDQHCRLPASDGMARCYSDRQKGRVYVR